MKAKSLIPSILIVLCSLCSAAGLAQKHLDSLVDVTTNKVFEDPEAAIRIGEDVLTKATKPKTKTYALMLISNAYLSKRENTKSLEYALKTRQYLDKISSEKTRINVLNTIGMQYQQLGIYDKAIDYLDEALQRSKKITDPEKLPSLLGFNYTIRGFIYREQMSCQIALNYFNKAIFHFKKISADNSMTANLSTLCYNKGNCFLQISQIDSARVNFKKSIAYAQSIGANSLYAFAKKGLSEVYTVEGNYNQAITALEEAEKASQQVGDLILNQGIYKNFSDNYLALNNHDLYKIYFDKYKNVQKQIHIKEEKTINNSIKDTIEENQLHTEKTLLKLQTVQWILLGLIIALFVILTILTLKNHKKLKKAQAKLESLTQ
ncbi:tetratricopeptide repeat protein [Marixanthomonas spongiae]|uniref:Tetratricopeptide repeat protein n=1 Tax=Marixanthomonas spongiae TaxID=2174845 RepID=A0A2U0I5P3_9FLAO|nr:tetratricopeptide repeat protein [Marixanthomonas spongiae]PVW16427.1 hypothetical protein DDV96_03985 [Marixanthomonas spongiae]